VITAAAAPETAASAKGSSGPAKIGAHSRVDRKIVIVIDAHAGPQARRRHKSAMQASIYDLLKADHKTVKALFEEMEASEQPATRTRLLARLKYELLAHSEAEDVVFYQPLKPAESTHALILEAEEEHRVVSRLLGELERLSPESDKWKARLTVLKGLVEHHVEEEEGELFKRAKRQIDSAQEQEIGAFFLAEKQRIQAALRSAA
jgi:hemerythrin superfamily protein